jgi:hypothetical protein
MSEAENGQVGLEKMRQIQPDLVITDIAMPELTVYELLKQVRQASDLKELKVIVSSASVSQSDQQFALNAGGDTFLAKPVDSNELLHLLTSQLNLEWRYAQVDPDPIAQLDVSGEMIVPASQDLKILLGFVQQDNLKALRERIESLVRVDGSYSKFAAPLLQLAKQFKAEEIEELLQQYLAQEKADDQ